MARLKGSLAAGYERGFWDFEPMFAVTLPRLPAARQEFYRSLGSAVLDESKLDLLQAFDEWRSLEPIDPFTPFSTP